jgi:hypothetical protein
MDAAYQGDLNTRHSWILILKVNSLQYNVTVQSTIALIRLKWKKVFRKVEENITKNPKIFKDDKKKRPIYSN